MSRIIQSFLLSDPRFTTLVLELNWINCLQKQHITAAHHRGRKLVLASLTLQNSCKSGLRKIVLLTLSRVASIMGDVTISVGDGLEQWRNVAWNAPLFSRAPSSSPSQMEQGCFTSCKALLSLPRQLGTSWGKFRAKHPTRSCFLSPTGWTNCKGKCEKRAGQGWQFHSRQQRKPKIKGEGGGCNHTGAHRFQWVIVCTPNFPLVVWGPHCFLQPLIRGSTKGEQCLFPWVISKNNEGDLNQSIPKSPKVSLSYLACSWGLLCLFAEKSEALLE